MHHSNLPIVKRGDSFLVGMTALVDGAPPVEGIESWEITSKVRTAAGLHVADLTVEVEDPITAVFYLSAVTDAWPLGQLEFDVSFLLTSGQRTTSETIRFLLQGRE